MLVMSTPVQLSASVQHPENHDAAAIAAQTAVLKSRLDTSKVKVAANNAE
ncbi:hypothetical protein AwPolaro_06840 [Polaromonas sp.]|nr:hypothetical protein AwPolaro_06840 [Polaromonas sp.]